MSKRASRGERHLGRTFHGLKDNRRSVTMRAMQTGGGPSSIGDIARPLAFNRAFGQIVVSWQSFGSTTIWDT
jgi:hypothetical protein